MHTKEATFTYTKHLKKKKKPSTKISSTTSIPITPISTKILKNHPPPSPSHKQERGRRARSHSRASGRSFGLRRAVTLEGGGRGGGGRPWTRWPGETGPNNEGPKALALVHEPAITSLVISVRSAIMPLSPRKKEIGREKSQKKDVTRAWTHKKGMNEWIIMYTYIHTHSHKHMCVYIYTCTCAWIYKHTHTIPIHTCIYHIFTK